MNKALGVFVFGLASLAGHAQWIHEPTRGIPRTADGTPDLAAPAPRSADGKPDLSGIWSVQLAGGSGISELKPAEIKPWRRRCTRSGGKIWAKGVRVPNAFPRSASKRLRRLCKRPV
jgi:hypothetical protein